VGLAEQQVVRARRHPHDVVAEDPGGVVAAIAAAGVVEQDRAAPAFVGGVRIGALDKEERIPPGAVLARPGKPFAIEPVLGDWGVAAERTPRAVKVEGLDELADAERGGRARPVVAAELVAGEGGDVGRASGGERSVQVTLGAPGKVQVPG
jgi:hypothetical protein